MSRRRVSQFLSAEALVITVASAYAVLMTASLSVQVAQDTWLALVGGRGVAEGGLPTDDYLTAWSLGEQWVDQQWLGQLVFYGLDALGGLKLVLLLHAVLASCAFSLAIAFARRRGGSQRMVARVSILALSAILIVTTTIRTQTFGYLLFVAVLWLTIEDFSRPSRRALWLVALLALWANIHGSVLLGAGLVVLSGMTLLARGIRAAGRQSQTLRHGALLLAIGLLSPLISPYAPSLASYYQSTLFNSEFDRLITEWLSPAPSVTTASFYLLAAVALWLIGRGASRLTIFERLVLLLTLAAGMMAIRNIVWFALAATMLLPVLAEEERPSREPRGVPVWFGATLSSVALLGVIAALAAVAASSLRGYESRYPPEAADAVWSAAQRDPASKIFADERYADWLLWRYPSLAGRILFDARFELFSASELKKIAAFHLQVGPRWRDAIAEARILVLRERTPISGFASSIDVLRRDGSFDLAAEIDDVFVLTKGR